MKQKTIRGELVIPREKVMGVPTALMVDRTALMVEVTEATIITVRAAGTILAPITRIPGTAIIPPTATHIPAAITANPAIVLA